MSEPQSEIESAVGDRTAEHPDEFLDHEADNETVMLPDPQREGAAKVDASGDMASEFGPYGEANGVDTEVGKMADPRNWTESTSAFAPGRIADEGIPEPQYEGEYPEGTFDEDVEVDLESDDEPEDDEEERAYYRRLGSTLKAEEMARAQRKELEVLTEKRVHKQGERNFDVTLNEKQAELDHQCHEEMKEHDSRPAYEKILDDFEPRAHVGQEKLAKIHKFAQQIVDQIGGISHRGVAKRIAMKVADPIDTPQKEKEITLDATGETITIQVGTIDIPLDYDGSFQDPFAEPISVFNAAMQVKDELLYELPRTADGVSEYHRNASVEGTITQKWDPAHPKQRDAFNMKDANGEIIKVVIWEKADGKKYGLDSFNLIHLDWNDHTGIPELYEGDTIRIYDGKPSKWQDVLNIACTQDSLITVEERGEQFEEEIASGPTYEDYNGQNPTYYQETKKVTDTHDDGVTSLAHKRYRPVWAVRARHGDYDRSKADDGSGPKEEPPTHPGKMAGDTDTGWRFCNKWIFPMRMCPDWWLEQNNVETVNNETTKMEGSA